MAETGDMLELLRQRGYLASSMSIFHLEEVREDVEQWHRQGVLDEDLYQDYLFRFKYRVPDSFPEAKSLIIVAVPQPMCGVTFTWEGRKIRAVVPPTYANAVEVDMKIIELLEEGDGTGVHLMRAVLPQKTLAARTGLVEYGRNNITYVPRYGSFHRLTSFFTNRELPDDWQEVKVMERCNDCGACEKACPTRAISNDRFLLHAERCLTYHNEMPAETPFPSYVLEGMHNAVVGCMICQRVCPVNAEVNDWTKHCQELDEDETQYLMSGDFSGPKAKTMAARLEPLGLDLSIFPRNLKAILDQVERDVEAFGETGKAL
jgi:epoxyqueuosine reductase